MPAAHDKLTMTTITDIFLMDYTIIWGFLERDKDKMTDRNWLQLIPGWNPQHQKAYNSAPLTHTKATLFQMGNAEENSHEGLGDPFSPFKV